MYLLLSKSKNLLINSLQPNPNQVMSDKDKDCIQIINKIDMAMEMIKFEDKDVNRNIEMIKVNKIFVEYYSDLLKNMNKIYKKHMLVKQFRRYFYKVFKHETIRQYRNYKLKSVIEPKIKMYLLKCLDFVSQGTY